MLPFFQSKSKEQIFSQVEAILAQEDSKTSDELHHDLKQCAEAFIGASREIALKYAGNRILWNKQPLFFALLSDQLSKKEGDIRQKDKLDCYAVYCYALAGKVNLAQKSADRSLGQGDNDYLMTHAKLESNQTECPSFTAIVYEAAAIALVLHGMSEAVRAELIFLYQKATFFYAQAQYIDQAKQCVKQWLTFAKNWKPLTQEASNLFNYQHHPLYCGIIFDLRAIKLLTSTEYGKHLADDSDRLQSYFGNAMRCYAQVEHLCLLKSTAYTVQFIDPSGSTLYTILRNDIETQSKLPLLIAVFHEVYEQFDLAAEAYEQAGFPTESLLCLQQKLLKQKKDAGNCSCHSTEPGFRDLSAESRNLVRTLDPADMPRDVGNGRAVTDADRQMELEQKRAELSEGTRQVDLPYASSGAPSPGMRR